MEGTVSFSHPTLPKPCQTWYKIYGDLKSSSTSRPLVLLHGGPGAAHNYLLTLSELSTRYGVAVVFYDQLGCGKSTHLREKRLDSSFWTPQLLMDELENLLAHLDITEYDLLGQSWGGMFGSMWAIRHPKGLNKLIISNSPASMTLWVESCNGLRRDLPREVDEVLQKHEKEGTYEDPEYEEAVEFFYKRHMCRVYDDNGFPQDVKDSLDNIKADDTVYFTMNGPSEFTVIGSLKHWSVVDEVKNIVVPTLVLRGELDEAQDVCVKPFEAIPTHKSYVFKGGSHMTHVEMPDEYFRVVMDFLQGS